MPFAPVLLEKNIDYFFEAQEYERIIGSDNFMVVTYKYRQSVDVGQYGGVMHKHPLQDHYTGRPQIIRKKDTYQFIYLLLDMLEKVSNTKCLINTSFNVHGNPIVYSENDIVSNFNFQCKMAEKENIDLPYLVIIT